MKRSQLVTAIALSLGITGWFSPWLTGSARAGDCDHPRSSSCGCADVNRGLLYSLDEAACRVLDKREQRPSLLSTLKSNLSRTVRHHSKCDQPTCGAEANCGVEATCGVEANCGVEPACGVEPSRGHANGGGRYLPRSSAMNHHVSPVDASRQPPGMYPDMPQVPHVSPHTHQYQQPLHTYPIPPQMHQLPAIPGPRSHSVPQLYPAAPGPAPHGQLPPTPPTDEHPAVEAIPVPQVQDSITDPFRDDAAIQFQPRRIPAHPATHRLPMPRNQTQQNSAHGRQPILHYDPQARASMSAHGHISSDGEPSSAAVAGAPLPTSRLDREESAGEMSSRSSRQAATRPAEVVPASASEPARLAPLKAVPQSRPGAVDRDSGSSRNPLRS